MYLGVLETLWDLGLVNGSSMAVFLPTMRPYIKISSRMLLWSSLVMDDRGCAIMLILLLSHTHGKRRRSCGWSGKGCFWRQKREGDISIFVVFESSLRENERATVWKNWRCQSKKKSCCSYKRGMATITVSFSLSHFFFLFKVDKWSFVPWHLAPPPLQYRFGFSHGTEVYCM